VTRSSLAPACLLALSRSAIQRVRFDTGFFRWGKSTRRSCPGDPSPTRGGRRQSLPQSRRSVSLEQPLESNPWRFSDFIGQLSSRRRLRNAWPSPMPIAGLSPRSQTSGSITKQGADGALPQQMQHPKQVKHSKQVKHPMCCKWMPQEIALSGTHRRSGSRHPYLFLSRLPHRLERGGGVIDAIRQCHERCEAPDRPDRSPVTPSPGPFSTGIDSPVTIDSSTPSRPFQLCSNARNLCPGETRIRSSGAIRSSPRSSAPPTRRTRALFEANPRTARIALPVSCRALPEGVNNAIIGDSTKGKTGIPVLAGI